jgi:hypothetical protein
MARISFPERGVGEHVGWALLRPEMVVGRGGGPPSASSSDGAGAGCTT